MSKFDNVYYWIILYTSWPFGFYLFLFHSIFNLQERTKNAQFIVISLRNNMFELADRLVGIYKTHNCSKTVTVNPRKLGLKEAIEASA